jgi:ornithine decarboxylase
MSMEPYSIMDLTKINDSYALWVAHLPEIQVYYAMKCNPHPMILQHVVDLGIQVDCASKQEIISALQWTTPDRILYANPCKFASHLTYAKEQNVGLTVVDCECELYKMKELYPECKLLIRLAVADTSSQCQLSRKFGCSMEDVPALLTLCKDLELPLVGFSFHVGSGCTLPTLYYDALVDCQRATHLAETMGLTVNIIDIGGGFNQANFMSCSKQVKRGLPLLPGKQFISEVGRFLVEQTHTLYVEVICKKKKDKRIYYLNDGLYGTLNCKIFDHVKPVFRHKKGELFESMLFGPTCDSFDMIEESILLPELEVGDQLVLENWGAYTNASSTSFNGYTVDIKTVL